MLTVKLKVVLFVDLYYVSNPQINKQYTNKPDFLFGIYRVIY